MNDVSTPIKRGSRAQDGTVAAFTIPASPFLRKIGYGTGVAVYQLKRSPRLDKFRSPWAIKKLLRKVSPCDVEHRRRLDNEAEVLRRLSHPNIVGFRAFFRESDGRPCLAMEECDACLGDIIEQRGTLSSEPFPAKTICKVGSDLAKALDYLHNEALLMHCDIKSYNLLIKGDFLICKLCDFGVSLPVDSRGNLDVCKAGKNVEYVGTPIWSAPEVSRYPQIITTKADVYAFGLVLWEMLALMPPTNEESIDSFEMDVDDDDCEDSVLEKTGEKKSKPLLPDYGFGPEYNCILEAYEICTQDDFKARPSACQLNLLFGQYISNNAN